MPRKQENPQTTMTNVRMPVDLRDELRVLAEKDGRSLHNFIIHVLRKAAEESSQTTKDGGRE